MITCLLWREPSQCFEKLLKQLLLAVGVCLCTRQCGCKMAGSCLEISCLCRMPAQHVLQVAVDVSPFPAVEHAQHLPAPKDG